MTRKPIFDAVRAVARPGLFNDPGNVLALDNILDAFGVPRDAPEKPDFKPESLIPGDYWPMLAEIESGNRPYVKANSSTASGLYQFVRATWVAEGGKWGSDSSLAFGGLKPPPEEQLARAKTFTARNVVYLRSKGIPINKASLYAAHFLGPVTAANVIGADVNASAEQLAGPAATKANPTVLKGKTVRDFLVWLHRKTGEWGR